MQCGKCGYIRTGREQTPDWQCPECGIAYNKISKPTPELTSNKTKAAPKNKNASNPALPVIAGALALVIAVIFAFLPESGANQKNNTENGIKESQNEQVAQDKLNHAVADLLKKLITNGFFDPESARFSDLVLHVNKLKMKSGETITLGSYSLCGLVNAKNRMGGYVGKRGFVAYTVIQNGEMVTDGTGASIQDPDSPDSNAYTWIREASCISTVAECDESLPKEDACGEKQRIDGIRIDS